jgi:N-acetylmuramoyl-L-alanine amidase
MVKVSRRILLILVFIDFMIIAALSGFSFGELPDGLRLGKDSEGEYASYMMQKGETVWSAVISRYVKPAYRTNKTTADILKRSGISDAAKLHEGIEIKIPLTYLAENIEPKQLVKVKPLEGVVVILDPGHGGIDSGAIGRGAVYEDEINYDLAARLKKKLEEKTGAKAYMTVRDRSRGNAENHSESFPSDEDEYILTNPAYYIKDSKLGVNLRWYLANSIYRREVRAKTSPNKIVFISIHSDALGSQSRGTMIYYPGRNYCKEGFKAPNATYKRFQEVKECPNVSYGYSERVKSESLSIKLAQAVVSSLRAKKIMVYYNRPIRDHITRSSSFAPAVLKYNAVPTKILIESVNLENKADVAKIKNAGFRDLYAEALLDALIKFYR